jgi:hypothetical protein
MHDKLFLHATLFMDYKTFFLFLDIFIFNFVELYTTSGSLYSQSVDVRRSIK